MTQLPPGMYRPGESVLHQLDAAIKTLCFLMLLIVVPAAVGLAGHTFLFIITACIAYLSEFSVGEILAPVKHIRMLLFLIFVLNSCFYAPELAFIRWWIFAPSFAGMTHGVGLALKLSCTVVLCCLFSATTPPLRLMSGIEKLLWPFYRLGLPAGKLALVFAVALQFIPAFFSRAEQIRLAQVARGAQFETKSYFERAEALLPLLLPIFVGAFRRAAVLAEAMTSRGYRGEGGRALPHWNRPDMVDWAALTVCTAALALELFIL